MARRSVWNSVYFISTGEGDYNWEIEILDEDTHRVKKRYTIKADHIDDARRRVQNDLEDGEIGRIDGTEYVHKY
jgi:hypothetical protein